MAFELNSIHNDVNVNDVFDILRRSTFAGRQTATTSFGLLTIQSTSKKLSNYEVDKIVKDVENRYKRTDLTRQRLQRKLNQRVEKE